MNSRKPAFGLYDLVLTQDLKAILDQFSAGALPKTSPLGRQENPDFYLHQHLGVLIKRVLDRTSKDDKVARVNEVVNALAALAPDIVTARDLVTPEILEALLRHSELQQERLKHTPGIPLSRSALLTNAHDEQKVGSELAREIYWADRIDCLCAFIKWSGLQQLSSSLKAFLTRGGRLRVITTTYMQASDWRAIDELVRMGAQVKISYDSAATRLHAKAWLFHRDTDFTTAYIGSSNLLESALMHGLEWNVRVSKVDARPIVNKFAAAFDTYWEDARFERYDGRREHQERLKEALKKSTDTILIGELHPYDFQEEILQRLEVDRFVHGRMRNLVVAATGTGKTVIAAIDYRRLCVRKEHKRRLSLLFVAHREEILKQSRNTFRLALRDDSFGELLVGGHKPEHGTHLFASVQSLAHVDLTRIDATRFDIVIIDEFHHAAAPTYERILDHFLPKYLLGLTATPERADGQSVLKWIGGRIAAELRLWDAISIGRLVPFRYFGVSDETDLSAVKWRRGQYDQTALTNLYTASDMRAKIILRATSEHVLDVTSMRAIGFCVSVRHAELMARRFSDWGIPARAVTGTTPRPERRGAIKALEQGEVNVLFTVDVLTEGVDIPAVDTILLLRPTNSATVFLQQIGRGLRKHEGKDALVILDFVGQSHREFRFDFKFSALLGGIGRGAVKTAIEDRFPPLPSGCSIDLDEESREIILNNLRQAIGTSKSRQVEILIQLGPTTTLRQLLDHEGITIQEFYKRSYLTSLRRAAGFDAPQQGPDENRLGKKLHAILHVDDPERIRLYKDAALGRLERSLTGTYQRRQLTMLLCSLYDLSVVKDVEGNYDRMLANPAICAEIVEICDCLQEEIVHLPKVWAGPADVPLKVHCRYSMHELMAAFHVVSQKGDLVHLRSGVYFEKKTKCNLLLVTIDKSEKYYTPDTMYHDYALSPTLFHWQSQNTTRADSGRGRRHRDHKELGVTPLLFVRRDKKDEYRNTEPYMFLGPVEFVSSEGNRPMNILWKLETPMPADLVRVAKQAA